MATHLQKLPDALLPNLTGYPDSDSALSHLLWIHDPESVGNIFVHYNYR